MTRASMFKLAISGLALAAIIGGPSTVVGASSGNSAVNPARAARAAQRAQQMLGNHHADRALRYAEDAVAMDPGNGAHRATLGQVYMALGRFASAEQSFADAASLGVENNRTIIGRALAQVANNRAADAVSLLDANASTLPASDYGLALTLAGQPQRAVLILTDVVRAGDSTPRDRQNLALAYAMSGRWLEARLIAAQDIGLARVGDRMAQWAQMGQAGDPRVRIAAMLGTQVTEDSGLPVRLALNSATPSASALAMNDDPAPLALYAPSVPAMDSAAAAAVDAATDGDSDAAAAVDAAVDVAPAASADTAMAVDVAPSVAAPNQGAATGGITFVSQPVVQPLRSLIAMIAPLARPDAPRTATRGGRPVRVAGQNMAGSAPAAAATADSAAPVAPAATTRGWSVQLGAFANIAVARAGWTQASRRFAAPLAGHEAVSTSASVNGRTVYRLAATGFASRAAADAACRSIAGAGGACFVRQIAPGEPIRWASRQTGTQIASR